jgi:hypothetical protein
MSARRSSDPSVAIRSSPVDLAERQAQALGVADEVPQPAAPPEEELRDGVGRLPQAPGDLLHRHALEAHEAHDLPVLRGQPVHGLLEPLEPLAPAEGPAGRDGVARQVPMDGLGGAPPALPGPLEGDLEGDPVRPA